MGKMEDGDLFARKLRAEGEMDEKEKGRKAIFRVEKV